MVLIRTVRLVVGNGDVQSHRLAGCIHRGIADLPSKMPGCNIPKIAGADMYLLAGRLGSFDEVAEIVVHGVIRFAPTRSALAAP
jgi:hypothetical protein